jgi:hypothetical protein
MVRSIQFELAIAVVILGLVASWRFTPPPRSLFAAAAQPIHIHIHAEKAMAELQIEPPAPDGRRITIGVLDGEFRPLAAKEVELFLSKPDAGIEPRAGRLARENAKSQRHRGLNAPPRPTPAQWGGALAKHFDNGSVRPISSTRTREPTVTLSRGAASRSLAPAAPNDITD